MNSINSHRTSSFEQESSVFLDVRKHVIFFYISVQRTGNEARLLHEIGREDRPPGEAQMAPRDTARFLGVISEVRLRIIISVFADDLNGALIGADGSVAADTVENQLAHVIAQNIDIPGHRQRQMGDVINDADREIVQSFFALFEIFKHGENLSGIRVLLESP